ncbi:hypothetical protein GEMRC1_011917 [Eukaryota sp. GEM-RC1]
MKPSIINQFELGKYPKSLAEYSPNLELFGFVKKVYADRIILGFPFDVSGISKGVGLEFSSGKSLTPGDRFKPNQTVYTRVASVGSQVVSLSCKPITVTSPSRDFLAVSSFFHSFEPTLTLPQLPTIGSLVEVLPVQQLEAGLVCSLITGETDGKVDVSEDITVVVPEHLLSPSETSLESSLWVRVVATKARIGLVEVTNKPELMGPPPKSSEKRGRFKKQKVVVEEGVDVTGSIIHVSNDCLTVAASVDVMKRPLFVLVPIPFVAQGFTAFEDDATELLQMFPLNSKQVSLNIQYVAEKDGCVVGLPPQNLEELLNDTSSNLLVNDLSVDDYPAEVIKGLESINQSDDGHISLSFGQKVSAVVVSKSNHHFVLTPSLGVIGILNLVDAAHSIEAVNELYNGTEVGDVLSVFVLSITPLMFTVVENNLAPGAVLLARIKSCDKKMGRFLELPSNKIGYCHVTDLVDDLKDLDKSNLPVDGFVRCKIVEAEGVHADYCVSLAPSEVNGSPRSILKISDVRQGQKCTGIVVGQAQSGLFVSLSRHITARVRETQINKRQTSSIGSIITVWILQILDNKISLTMKPEFAMAPPLSSTDVGSIVSGLVKNISDKGVFVAVGASSLGRGIRKFPTIFIHQSKVIEKGSTEDWSTKFSVGDSVKVKINHFDESNSRSFGSLRSSDVGEIETPMEESETLFEKPSIMIDDSDDELDEDRTSVNHDSEVESDEDDVFETLESEEEGVVKLDETDDEAVELNLDSEEDSSSEDDEEEIVVSKSAMAEEEVKEIEDDLVEGNQLKNVADFERELMANSESVELWIHYAATCLAAADIEKSREVFYRAVDVLKTSSESTLLNIWTAFLNFEYSYGDSQSFSSVFDRMKMSVDQSKANLVFAKLILKDEAKFNPSSITRTLEIIDETTKKCHRIPEFWNLVYSYLSKFELAYPDVLTPEYAPESVLKRALHSLPTRFHVDVTRQSAQNDFKIGNFKRARILFEELLSKHPKRSDLWFVYIDMEISYGENEFARQLYNRAATVNFSSKPMRTLFRRWSAFEAKFGDDNGVERVKAAAKNYLESKV